jgi:S1-C subfamily serine protease
MTFETAQTMRTNVTYGYLINSVTKWGPAYNATLQEGDIIIAINGTRIKNTDDLSTYLEENTLPGQTITVTVVRDNQKIFIAVTLGTRPPPTSS